MAGDVWTYSKYTEIEEKNIFSCARTCQNNHISFTVYGMFGTGT